jgi:ssDNA-binding Zn-finger/Zn-ribbon topoisomerase 1
MSLKKNIRLYGGVCPDCGLFLWRYLKRRSAKSGVPGVHLRCSECTAIAYARPVRSHTIRQEPEWVADPEQVVEWFDENIVELKTSGVGTGAVATTDGGEQT